MAVDRYSPRLRSHGGYPGRAGHGPAGRARPLSGLRAERSASPRPARPGRSRRPRRPRPDPRRHHDAVGGDGAGDPHRGRRAHQPHRDPGRPVRDPRRRPGPAWPTSRTAPSPTPRRLRRVAGRARVCSDRATVPPCKSRPPPTPPSCGRSATGGRSCAPWTPARGPSRCPSWLGTEETGPRPPRAEAVPGTRGPAPDPARGPRRRLPRHRRRCRGVVAPTAGTAEEAERSAARARTARLPGCPPSGS
jgi:hypothetical protein